jgi:hypothetical protein
VLSRPRERPCYTLLRLSFYEYVGDRTRVARRVRVARVGVACDGRWVIFIRCVVRTEFTPSVYVSCVPFARVCSCVLVCARTWIFSQVNLRFRTVNMYHGYGEIVGGRSVGSC